MDEEKFRVIVTDFKDTYISEDCKRDILPNEVLVKVHSAAINPNDQLFTLGYYGDNNYLDLPIGVGFEGSGLIIEVGDDVDPSLLDKKIAFMQQPSMPNYSGTWRQFIYINADGLATYPDELDYDSIATISINPPTVWGFFDITERKKAKSIIHDAASSSLGRMLVRSWRKYEITLINIVRRQEQVDILEEEGAEIVIDSSLDNWEESLKQVIGEHKPTVFFDAIGGVFSSKVLSLMPNNSTMYVYGNLSGEAIHYDASNLIFKGHNISNFFIWAWINSLTVEEKSHWFGIIVDDINSGGEVFGTKILRSFGLRDFKEAMKFAKDHASSGKVILKPHE
jgi:NADPH2:quinone reductase